MRPTFRVCVDASLLVKLALPEADADLAHNLWRQWRSERVVVVVPNLATYEFVSATRQQVRKRLITAEEAEVALLELLALPIQIVDMFDLHRLALRSALDFNLPSAYDAHYVALAESLECEFWTADARLYNSVAHRFPLIRLLGS